MKIASDFEEKWQFPHCLGAIDGKHVQIVPPKDSGSQYYNYKKTHSIVLMAIANAHCEFIYCDVGTNGRISDGGVINNTIFYERLVNNQLDIPAPEPVSFDLDLEYVFVGDNAFAMRPDLSLSVEIHLITREEYVTIGYREHGEWLRTVLEF